MEQLSVYLDLGNIAGYRALAPTRRLIEETGVKAVWLPVSGIIPRPLARPYVTNVDDPLDAYKAKRAAARYKTEMRELERDCEALDLPLELAQRRLDAGHLHEALLWLHEQGQGPLKFIEAAYQHMFRNGELVDTPTKVQGLLAASGYDEDVISGFMSFSPARLAAHQASLLEAGIFDSPAYLWQGELFQGRQHLPLLHWHLTGKQGVPPT